MEPTFTRDSCSEDAEMTIITLVWETRRQETHTDVIDRRERGDNINGEPS